MSLQTSSILPHRVAVAHRRESSRHDIKTRPHSDEPQKSRSRTALRLRQGRAGDHVAIHPFLQSLLHAPSESEFQLNLDRPGYDPAERLLLWRGDDLIGHIRLTCRLIRFRNAWISACDLSEFALLPEFGHDAERVRLLRAAEDRAIELGAVLLTSRTHGDDVPSDSSWVAKGGVNCAGGSPRDLLAKCATLIEAHPRVAKMRVRPWRYVEQSALAEIYDANTQNVDGTILREEEYWHWLLIRRGFDEILVVTKPSEADDLMLGEASDDIVGYAFVRGSDIVEIMTLPDWDDAALPLIQRVAGDAIERDDHRVGIFEPPQSFALSNLIERISESTQSERSPHVTQAIYVVDPISMVEICSKDVPKEQLRQVGDATLGLNLRGQLIVLESTTRGVLRSKRETRTRSLAEIRTEDVTSFLFGEQPGESRNHRFSSAAARRLADAVFQPVTLWRSTLDDLPSSS